MACLPEMIKNLNRTRASVVAGAARASTYATRRVGGGSAPGRSGRLTAMSPASRGRKPKKTNPRKSRPSPPAAPALFELPDECDCPECTGAALDPSEMIDALTESAAELVGADDPLDAELVGALIVSNDPAADADSVAGLVANVIPELEARANAGALALLLSLGAVAPGPAGKDATAAAGRVVAAGVPLPSWATELEQPVSVSECWRLHDTDATASVLAGSFGRAGRSHALVVTVDELDCGAASGIALLDSADLPEVLNIVQAETHDTAGFEVLREALSPADFRWHVENALDARAAHDQGRLADDGPADDEDDNSSYPTLALLLRARMADLPEPAKRPAPHRGIDQDVVPAALQMLARLAEQAPFGTGPLPGRTRTRSLPAKRKKSERPAPGYQIKVALRGAKPPIWRRLEVPADISLARLHNVIQVAFGWHDSHLHAYSTPYGDFGAADPELGHRAEAPVTLEQVAPEGGSKINYTYDFGDDWQHDIVVEKVLGPGEPSRPRCTGGRRAAPPEDSGGVWGYAELVASLTDPHHPEREHFVEWLGLDDPDDFDPDRFDADAVTQGLAQLR
jgi:hypothetical protein